MKNHIRYIKNKKLRERQRKTTKQIIEIKRIEKIT